MGFTSRSDSDAVFWVQRQSMTYRSGRGGPCHRESQIHSRSIHFWYRIYPKKLRNLQERSNVSMRSKVRDFYGTFREFSTVVSMLRSENVHYRWKTEIPLKVLTTGYNSSTLLRSSFATLPPRVKPPKFHLSFLELPIKRTKLFNNEHLR
jgi:hypothetical protein